MTLLPRTLPLVVGALALAACGNAEGQLAHAPLDRPCGADGTACSTPGIGAPLAVKATVSLSVLVEVAGSTAPPVELQVVDPSVARVDDDGRIVGVAEGVSAVLAFGPDGRVLDFLHLWVAAPTRLTLHRVEEGVVDDYALPEAIQLHGEDDLEVAVAARRQTQPLVGDYGAVWELDGEGFQLLDEGHPFRRRVLLPEAGSAELTVRALDHEARLRLEVIP